MLNDNGPVMGQSKMEARNQSPLWETDVIERPEWQQWSNCAGMGVEFFFPARGELTRYAKEVCHGCIVRDECLEFAIDIKHGIWGGLSERERRAVRRQRALAAKAS